MSLKSGQNLGTRQETQGSPLYTAIEKQAQNFLKQPKGRYTSCKSSVTNSITQLSPKNFPTSGVSEIRDGEDL